MFTANGKIVGAAAITMTLGAGCEDAASPRAPEARMGALSSAAEGAVLGFEEPDAWTVSQGGTSSALSSREVHTEGHSSLAIDAKGFVVVKSRTFAASSAVTGAAAVDVFLPLEQPNPYWLGAVQLYVDCASKGVFNAFSGQTFQRALGRDGDVSARQPSRRNGGRFRHPRPELRLSPRPGPLFFPLGLRQRRAGRGEGPSRDREPVRPG